MIKSILAYSLTTIYTVAITNLTNKLQMSCANSLKFSKPRNPINAIIYKSLSCSSFSICQKTNKFMMLSEISWMLSGTIGMNQSYWSLEDAQIINNLPAALKQSSKTNNLWQTVSFSMKLGSQTNQILTKMSARARRIMKLSRKLFKPEQKL